MSLTIQPKTFPLGAGNTVYAGRTRPDTAPPIDTGTLRPPAGYFKNISQNTLKQAFAALGLGINVGDINGPTSNWCTALETPFGMAMYGGGHLSEGSVQASGTELFDLSTGLWTIKNHPASPLYEYAVADELNHYNIYGESTEAATLGHMEPPHTYTGLIYQSPSEGGGSRGTLWHNCFPGNGHFVQAVHKLDISQETQPGQRVVNNLPVGNSYPMASKDSGRGGYWIMNINGSGPLLFVKWDATYTSYPSLSYNTYGDHSLIYLPAPYDCLVGMGPGNYDSTVYDLYCCRITNNVPTLFNKMTHTGPVPVGGGLGGVWVSKLNCLVVYEGNGSNKVYRLTPPSPANLLTAPWVWTVETLQGQGGATPSRTGINTNNNEPFPMNGVWSRFLYHAGLDAFLWCGGAEAPVQAWTLQGM